MKRFIFLTILLCTTCPTVYCISAKNVLFVVVDDLRPSLGVYGDRNAFTPNIDKLATKSFVFNNVFAQQALCAPSRNSFLTSRRPDSLRLYDFDSYWRENAGNFTTLPQHFRENGYYTKSIGKIFHPGKSSNFTDDFPYSWSTAPFHPKSDVYANAKVCVDRSRNLENNLICPVIVELQPLKTLPDIETTQEALRFLKNHRNISGGKPYFLAVGFHKPHIPFKFPQEYLDFHPINNISLPTNLFRPPTLPTVAWNPWLDVKERHDIQKLNISFPFGRIPNDYTKKIIQSYNAATTYIDDLLGKILNNIDNNTIVVVTGDHGWSRGEHGEFAKYSNYDVATRVPLIIHLPSNNKSMQNINSLAELVDIFPTLVDLSGLSPALPVCPRNTKTILCTEGRSLMPLLLRNNYSSAATAAFSQYPRPGTYPVAKHDMTDKPKLRDIKIMGYSIRTERFRYTEWIGFNNTNMEKQWNHVFGRELYDHLIDPDENLNLANRPELKYTTNMLRKQLILGWRYA